MPIILLFMSIEIFFDFAFSLWVSLFQFFPTIIFITFWDFLMFYEIFLSPQVKQSAIITYEHHGIYELSY